MANLSLRRNDMGDYLKIINDSFPKRKSFKEKTEFRVWAINEAKNLGYEASDEVLLNKHHNVVIGDIKTAKTVFGAHYDTPALSLFPNIMIPRNPFMFYVYQFLGPIIMVIIALAIAFGLQPMLIESINIESRIILIIDFMFWYYLFFILFYRTFKNPKNVNDNTSGVASIFELMAKIDDNQKSKVAFVLFDNEEKGKLGSKALSKKYPDLFKKKLVVSMDCVGNGNSILSVAKEEALKLDEYQMLKNVFKDNSEFNVYHYPTKGSQSNSDYKSFPCGVGFMACKKNKLVGFYTPRIHTLFDTVSDNKNIEFVSNSLKDFVDNL